MEDIKKLGFILMSVVLFLSFSGFLRNQEKHADYVPDAETAKLIAEAIWLPIYGKAKLEEEKPFNAILKDSVWVVTGTLKPGIFGGTAFIKIQKYDCKVLRVMHGK